MQTTTVKWSNSQEISIPKHKTTKERLLEFYGADFDRNHIPQKEFDWGTPAGKEIW